MNDVLFVLTMTFGVFVQSLAGFGGPLFAMPIGIMLCGIGLAKPVMTVLAWITGVIVVATEFKYINLKELIKMVAVMMVGVLGSLWVADKINLNFLLIFYGIIVALIGAEKLFIKRKKEAPPIIQNICLGLAGIMQGLFVSGGSFLAVYSVAQLPEKREFRATVNAVWAIINTVMITVYFFKGMMTLPVIKMTGICILPTLFAVWLGGALTKKVKQQTFLKIIYIILIISGIVLFATNI